MCSPTRHGAGWRHLRGFAEELGPDHYIVDLRAAQPGDGFSWGRFGPRTPIRRLGTKRVFAYQRRSRWQRLRGV